MKFASLPYRFSPRGDLILSTDLIPHLKILTSETAQPQAPSLINWKSFVILFSGVLLLSLAFSGTPSRLKVTLWKVVQKTAGRCSGSRPCVRVLLPVLTSVWLLHLQRHRDGAWGVGGFPGQFCPSSSFFRLLPSLLWIPFSLLSLSKFITCDYKPLEMYRLVLHFLIFSLHNSLPF